jgi:hypothetical protein
MNVGSYLKRTDKTSLLDEELLILDVLFDSMDTFESLVKENYASWHNLPYSHHLELGSLRDLLNQLINNGIIGSHAEGHDDRIFYGLTETGGKLWELERAPDWERYCTDYSTVDEHGTWTLCVESPSVGTAKAFMGCANHCRLYGFNPDEIRMTTLSKEYLSTVYWKAFSTVCSMSVTTEALPKTNQVDWNDYEVRRSWWSNLAELVKFQIV